MHCESSFDSLSTSQELKNDVDRWTTTILERHAYVFDTYIPEASGVVAKQTASWAFFLAFWIVTLNH
jgi:hypothetical protein